jgi:hypothetical protein
MSNKINILGEATQYEDTLHLDLWYPRLEGNIKNIEVGLMDVRAADNIRISYDFQRDGWKIEQASKFEWDGSDLVCDPDWQEVSFIKEMG